MKRVKHNGCADERRIAVVLAGGQSKRFGSDKVFAKLGKRPLIEIIVETLVQSDFEVFISVAHPSLSHQFHNLNKSLLPDSFPFEGPLQAVYGCLMKLEAPKVLFVACDMPLLHPNVLQALWKQSSGSDITLLEHEGKKSPLPGVYSRSCLPILRKFLMEGRRDLRCLLEMDLSVEILEENNWRLLDPQGLSVFNINTLQDLEEVRQRY